MEPTERTKSSSEHSKNLGDISIFISTTEIPTKEITMLISAMQKYLLDNLHLDLATVKLENITEATKNGSLRTLKFYYKVLQAPLPEEK